MATLVQGPMALAALSFALTLLLAGPVLAQAPAPKPPPSAEFVAGPLAPGAPPAARGFQMAVRSGYAIPMGDATGADDDELSRTFGGQVPVLVELGGKLGPSLFSGFYVGMGFGEAGSTIGAMCRSGRISCSTQTVRFGAEMQVHLQPEGAVNPWLGYGVGLEFTSLSMRGPEGEASLSLLGTELAHLMVGVDFRLSKSLGLGPVLDLSAATYSSVTTELNGVEEPSASGQIAEAGIHAWLNLGARVVLFP